MENNVKQKHAKNLKNVLKHKNVKVSVNLYDIGMFWIKMWEGIYFKSCWLYLNDTWFWSLSRLDPFARSGPLSFGWMFAILRIVPWNSCFGSPSFRSKSLRVNASHVNCSTAQILDNRVLKRSCALLWLDFFQHHYVDTSYPIPHHSWQACHHVSQSRPAISKDINESKRIQSNSSL